MPGIQLRIRALASRGKADCVGYATGLLIRRLGLQSSRASLYEAASCCRYATVISGLRPDSVAERVEESTAPPVMYVEDRGATVGDLSLLSITAQKLITAVPCGRLSARSATAGHGIDAGSVSTASGTRSSEPYGQLPLRAIVSKVPRHCILALAKDDMAAPWEKVEKAFSSVVLLASCLMRQLSIP